jgi:hypothetical protein
MMKKMFRTEPRWLKPSRQSFAARYRWMTPGKMVAGPGVISSLDNQALKEFYKEPAD